MAARQQGRPLASLRACVRASPVRFAPPVRPRHRGWCGLFAHARGPSPERPSGPHRNECRAPVLSAQWFAPTERTRSTAIVGVSNCAHSEPQTPDQQITFHWSDLLPPPWTDGGTALVFVLGPALVPAEPAARVASRLKGYMFGEAIASAALLAAAVCMPRQPPFAPCGQARPKPAPPPPAWHLAPQLTSPSVEWPVILLLATGRARSATVQRTSMRDGFCRLIRLP
jgi:hypothetical protein